MSTTYLSFASIAQLHNNNLLTTSAIGELSNKARTYAKDPGVFSLASGNSDTVLYNFLSRANGADVVMPTALAESEIAISNWLFSQAKLGNITGSRPNTLDLLRQTFTVNIEITDIGEMVTNNQYWLPSFVQGTHTVGGVKHDFIFWMSDVYFRDQYPHVSFTVVHPVPLEEIDSLMAMNYLQLEERLRNETPDIIEKRTKELTEQAAWPYTARKVIAFEVHDLINTPRTTKAYWTYLEWGNGEDAEDQLFDQMQSEILAESSFTREQWEDKIPDLFNPLEFYVIPYFNRLGLENRTTGARTYSPISDRETGMELVNAYITPNMTEAHVIKSLQTVPFLYKSLHAGFVAKLNNREGMEKITALFPDYQLIPSTDPDFNMMNSETMAFIMTMESLLAAAETVTPISLPPMGITRIERFGKVYVAARVGKVKLVVLTKWQMAADGFITE